MTPGVPYTAEQDIPPYDPQQYFVPSFNLVLSLTLGAAIAWAGAKLAIITGITWIATVRKSSICARSILQQAPGEY
jgi:hypothetical protein